MNKFGNDPNFNSAKKKKRNKPEVEINRKPPNQRTSNKDVGEYIDYEEID